MKITDMYETMHINPSAVVAVGGICYIYPKNWWDEYVIGIEKLYSFILRLTGHTIYLYYDDKAQAELVHKQLVECIND